MAPFPPSWDGPALALTLILLAAAWLLGSIPTAWLLARRRLRQDIRRLGDGNVGAENAARVLGRQAGIITAAVDVGKGLAAILLARGLTGDDYNLPLALLTGAAAVIGHSWPVWLKGAGGRGAATAAGVLLGLTPAAAVPAALPALIVMGWCRSSTGCLAAFFIGTVGLAALYAGLQLFGYACLDAAGALAMPALSAAIHFRREGQNRQNFRH